MKLKKIFASITAAALAAMTVALTSLTASAASQLTRDFSATAEASNWWGQTDVSADSLIGDIDPDSVEKITFNSPGSNYFQVNYTTKATSEGLSPNTTDGSAIVLTKDDISLANGVSLGFSQESGTITFTWTVTYVGESVSTEPIVTEPTSQLTRDFSATAEASNWWGQTDVSVDSLIGDIDPDSVEKITFNSPGSNYFQVNYTTKATSEGLSPNTTDGSAIVLTKDDISLANGVSLGFSQESGTITFTWTVTYVGESVSTEPSDTEPIVTEPIVTEPASQLTRDFSATAEASGWWGQTDVSVDSLIGDIDPDSVEKITFNSPGSNYFQVNYISKASGEELYPNTTDGSAIVLTKDDISLANGVSLGFSQESGTVTFTWTVTYVGESVSTEPSDTEPIVTEPIVTEPIVTEPIVTEPVVDEPVTAAPASTWYPYTTYNSDWEVAFWGHVGLTGNQGTSVENVESGAGVSDNLSEAQRTVGAVVISIAGISAAAAFAAIRKRKSLEK